MELAATSGGDTQTLKSRSYGDDGEKTGDGEVATF